MFQFFITLAEDLDYLDGVHTVFGEVAEGLDILNKVNEAFCDKEHRPYRDIRLELMLFYNQYAHLLKFISVIFLLVCLPVPLL